MTRPLEVLAVVPARGGSKGLPAKNLREVGGRSLVARAVDAALGASTVSRVVGSTDDTSIAQALRDAGAEVPALRPASLAKDETPDSPVFLHMVELLADDGYSPDLVVNVRPTAPLRTAQHIDSAVEALLSTPEAASLKTVSTADQHPYKMWTMAEDGTGVPVRADWLARFDGDPDVARQKLPVVYRSNGMVDVVHASALLDTGRFHPGVVALMVVDGDDAIDIDTAEDLTRAESILAARHSVK